MVCERLKFSEKKEMALPKNKYQESMTLDT